MFLLPFYWNDHGKRAKMHSGARIPFQDISFWNDFRHHPPTSSHDCDCGCNLGCRLPRLSLGIGLWIWLILSWQWWLHMGIQVATMDAAWRHLKEYAWCFCLFSSWRFWTLPSVVTLHLLSLVGPESIPLKILKDLLAMLWLAQLVSQRTAVRISWGSWETAQWHERWHLHVLLPQVVASVPKEMRNPFHTVEALNAWSGQLFSQASGHDAADETTIPPTYPC